MMNNGSFVISLDFELMWGNIESWKVDNYGKTHVAHVREVIERLLCLFEKYHVKATFATVGLVMLHHDEIQLPDEIPAYENKVLSPYGDYMMNIGKNNDALYFAPDIIEKLKISPCVEIGTHTYCHYYCWAKGQTIEQFNEDIKMACKVGEENGITLRSIVFPRNQVSQEHLEICARNGILTYRGNPKKYFENTSSKWKRLYNRGARLLDAYINWGGSTSLPYSQIPITQCPMNIPASRMLRPYVSKLRILESLRLRRIKNEIRHAAKNHELYHLWWHPHNFGANMKQNFSFLEEVLKCYQDCHQLYGMESVTMEGLYYKMTDK